MKLANLDGRAVIVHDSGVTDVASASGGAFGPDIHSLYSQWTAFRTWADLAVDRDGGGGSAVVPAPAPAPAAARYGPVSPRPSQVLAVGLNYRAHALESGLALPEVPLVFTKFPSSVAPAHGVVELPTDQVDWEVEVAVVIGPSARAVATSEAWGHVAGLTAAQDLSARDVQLAGGSAPQFSLGKSFPGFLPLGPVLATPDEFDDREAVGLQCSVNDEVVQSSSTSDLIFPIATLVSYLSHIVTLQPGDVILTGTPAGVGLGMTPPRYLRPGDVVTTRVDGVGDLRQECVAAESPFDPAAVLAR